MPPASAISRNAWPLRIDLGGSNPPDRIEVQLRHSRRAKRPSLRVRPGAAPEITLPPGASADAALRLLQEHREWLERKLRWSRSIEAQASELGLTNPDVVWLAGTGWSAPHLKVGPSEPATDAVERWYRRQAKVAISESVATTVERMAEAGLLNRAPGRITIRDTRSRWGSCAASGNLSFSWRLIMTPPPVLDYVVAHELCHLEIHNHSADFWRLVDAARPDRRREAAWLRDYGPMILLHRPPLPGTGPSHRLPLELPAVR